MADKAKVSNVEGTFIIVKGDKKEAVEGHKAMDQSATVRAILGAVKGAGTLQDAHQTMLHAVLNRPLLDSIKGKGDLSTGKIPPSAKELVRNAETACVNEWHAAGIKGIPSDEAERVKLASAIRVDGNYSNIKVTCLRYLAFCGKYPMTEAGYLVPKAVMLAEISAALNVTPKDDTFYARFLELKGEIDKGIVPEDDARKTEPLVRELAQLFKGFVAHYDELATNKAQGLPANAGDTPTVASEVIGKARRAPAPALM